MFFGYEVIIVGLMLMLNAIFSAYEMALASISHTRIAFLLEQKKRGAKDAAFMKNRMEASLALIQVGITVVGAFAAATAGTLVGGGFAPYLQKTWGIGSAFSEMVALLFLVIPLSLITIIFAELVPKVVALRNKEWVVLQLSPTMKVLSILANPVISILEIIVKAIVFIGTKKWRPQESGEQKYHLHELKAAISLARASKMFGAHEEKIVLAATQLSLRRVRDITLPAYDISMIYMGNSITEAFIKAHLDMHTRFPVCAKENDPQTIEGFINFKDILTALRISPTDPTVKGIMRPIQHVDGNTSLSELLGMMMRQKIHIVLVVEAERVIGMVTMEDIIEELVGEIEDEYDRLPTHIHPYGSGWIMGGGVPITTVAQTVGLDWSGRFNKGEAVPTLAEWCVQKVGGQLKGGEFIDSDNLSVMPRKFRRKRVSEAVVNLIQINKAL